MISSFFRRHRRRNTSSDRANTRDTEVPIDDDIESQLQVEDDPRGERGGTHSERALLIVAQNHMVAFVVTLYGIYIVCRLLGWKPGVKSTTYTITFGQGS
mmetsp:Transcript_10087/g.19402  ORF Transcript_10087/g.19402 Transcript_10087/m.19402 type:complete len:100 (+) Transcript_10087:1-300(+)